jgi:hypothetical protein
MLTEENLVKRLNQSPEAKAEIPRFGIKIESSNPNAYSFSLVSLLPPIYSLLLSFSVSHIT